jgi:hypothetical protein
VPYPQVDVLYAKIQTGDSPKPLQGFVDAIAGHFEACGLLEKQFGESIKMHVSVIRSRPATAPGVGASQSWCRRSR